MTPGRSMMKALVLNGSPRMDGTSASIAKDLGARLAGQGHVVTTFDLGCLRIGGCRECFSCRRDMNDECATRDDLSEILELARSTDLLVVSTPVFYGDVSAQLKCFIDRTWSYLGRTGVSADHLPRGRTLVFILSYGYNDPVIYDGIFEKYSRYFRMFGFDDCHLIKACGAQYLSPEITNRSDVAERIGHILEMTATVR